MSPDPVANFEIIKMNLNLVVFIQETDLKLRIGHT